MTLDLFGISISSETQKLRFHLVPFGKLVSLTSQIPQKLGIPNTETNSISILNNLTLDLYS